MKKKIASYLIAAAAIAGVSGTSGLAAGFHLGHDQAQGAGRCPTEDSCSITYRNGRWIVQYVGGDNSDGCHWDWAEDGSGAYYCGGQLADTRPSGTYGDGK